MVEESVRFKKAVLGPNGVEHMEKEAILSKAGTKDDEDAKLK